MYEVENYCVILELLNDEQQPVETIDYWNYDPNELELALARYDELNTDKHTAKCLILETKNDMIEILIKSEGYKNV